MRKDLGTLVLGAIHQQNYYTQFEATLCALCKWLLLPQSVAKVSWNGNKRPSQAGTSHDRARRSSIFSLICFDSSLDYM
jgi:hypothetical protein